MEWILAIVLLAVVIFALTLKKEPIGLDYKLSGPLFSPAERSFFGVLQQAVSDEYMVMGKVRVADILLPAKGLNKSQWQTAFNKISSKHFDFILCDHEELKVLAAIELDDKSHNSKKARNRDALLNSACESAGFPLIRFPAKKGYQIADIKTQIQTTIKGNSESVVS